MLTNGPKEVEGDMETTKQDNYFAVLFRSPHNLLCFGIERLIEENDGMALSKVSAELDKSVYYRGDGPIFIRSIKCKSASYCLKHPIDTQYHNMDNNKIFPLEKVKSMVDLGVRFDTNLMFRDHM